MWVLREVDRELLMVKLAMDFERKTP
jgi:hypothetical protein